MPCHFCDLLQTFPLPSFFQDSSSITEISAYYTISSGWNQPLIRRKWQQLAEISKIPALRQIPGI
ncbi:MAG: hypothetical protein IIZ06_04195, partial [Kiritimatiellae bacterium]|nr:hypothetical protein [Kiritimatiellia bacterium]